MLACGHDAIRKLNIYSSLNFVARNSCFTGVHRLKYWKFNFLIKKNKKN